LHHAIVNVLSRWSLEHLASSPRPSNRLPEGMHCMLVGAPVVPGAGRKSRSSTANAKRLG
jgi:hypothetical protein